MIKSDLNTEGFCVFCDWQPHLPDEFRHLTEPQWQAKSRRMDWVPYLRPLGIRSQAKYRRSDVTLFFRLKFGVLYPSAVQSLLAAGFPEPTLPEPGYPLNRKQRAMKRNTSGGKSCS
jgi:hypothetical protein